MIAVLISRIFREKVKRSLPVLAVSVFVGRTSAENLPRCFLEELEALNIPGAKDEVIHERVNSVEERERGNIVFLASPFATRPDYD